MGPVDLWWRQLARCRSRSIRTPRRCRRAWPGRSCWTAHQSGSREHQSPWALWTFGGGSSPGVAREVSGPLGAAGAPGLVARAGPPTRVDRVNINPHGPCGPLVEAARQVSLEKYPDPSALQARLAWSLVLDRPPEWIA